ncbi:hypothetical protein [Rhodocyclus purpureus]|uniref:hypothetical protein n=1 Tax=Rhodocyclus purpureus TaxID=1067 RepID=UPI0019116244|nr:hypothetical protein [Rhodocyclus purpureus]
MSSDFTLQISTTLDGVCVTLAVQVAPADLGRLLEVRERGFSGDEVSGLAQATLPALLPALFQARDQWLQSLSAAHRRLLASEIEALRSS